MYKTFFNNVGIIDLGSGKIKAGTSNNEEPTVYESLIGRPKYQKVTHFATYYLNFQSQLVETYL